MCCMCQINCPLNKKPKNKGKEIAMTITEALIIESSPTSWWVDSAATRHIARNRELFVDLKEKQLGEHRVYMGNNTYSDVLGEGRCKFSIGDSVIVLNNVLYVPSVRRNLISVPVLDEKSFEVKMKSGRVFISKGDIAVSGVKVDDDYSRYGYIYLLKYKSEAVEKFKEFKLEVENQLGISIKSLNNDRGGEYEAFDLFCKEMGIRHIYTMPYKPQQNRIVERRNRTLMDMMRSMMAYADPQIVFWGEALSTAAYILNRVKTKSKPLTPFEIWTGHQPDMTNLKVWGCKAHVLIPKPLRNKLIDKTWDCKFIGYVENGSGYRFFHPDKGLIESRDAVFIEDTKLITPLEQIKKLLHAEYEESDPHVSVFSDKDLENSGRKRTSPEPAMPSIDADDSGRKRQRRPSSMLKDYYLMESKAVAIEDDPVNFAKAMESHDAEQWLKAMHEELDSISKNEVWDLTELPTARLVAKGFTQQPGVDFVDTYSPVAKFASVRIIMVVAARLDLELHQLDIKTAFLNGDLKEEIYMDQPDGFQIKGQEGKVCRLKKSLYGFKAIFKTMKDKEKLALLSIYVDDILLASNSPDMMKETKFCLGSKFEMKDMGPTNYVLGIRIFRDRDSKLIYLDQENYLEKVLKRFKMEDCRPVSTPVSKGTILNKSMCPTNKIELEKMKAVPYAQAVGSLMYAMTSTRPDICYAVGLVSRYQSNPGKAHWQAVKQIFRYLQMTKNMKLCFGLDELEIKGFTDADFTGDTDDRKSTSEYVFLFGGTAVSWLSKKQGCVAKYTMEVEYIACSTAVSNAVWIKRFVDSLKLDMQDRPVNVFCDNKSTISLIKSGANSSKGKHIDVNYHYIQDIVERGEIKVHFVPSADMMADPMTKGLTLNQFRVHVTGMGLRGNSVELHSFARSDGPGDA
uniref:Integrase catalytic domain-containing protein n=1 Tax=Fagus sylvatica TaxID=28930 RepID=A0A2N9EP82_FAGSY